MFKKNFICSAIVASIVMFSSCQKEDSLVKTSEVQNQETSTTPKLKASTVYAEEYSVKQIYKNYYTHYYEYTGTTSFKLWPPTVTRSTSSLCGPSALMVATGMVANGEKRQSNYYVVNKDAVGEIIKKMQSAYPTVTEFGHTHLYYALTNYLGKFVSSSQSSTTSRETIKTFIKKELAAGNLVVMPVVIAPSNRVLNYDTDHSDVSERNYYVARYDIDGSLFYGHFIVINKLQLESTGSGYVEYYDVLESSSPVIKRASYSRILDSNMWSSTYNNAYCAFAVKKI